MSDYISSLRKALGANDNRSTQTGEGGIVIHGGITINLVTATQKKSDSNVHSGQGAK
ncbi:MAG: hypothetical protein HWE34_04240 [Methylocystaceae bacterium]|nr:hypothetical protein [Methylocystaceae bacterium]